MEKDNRGGKMSQIEPIEFNVKFITPLLIHGADSKKADSIGLTGKALRGCWRFWFRALVGGIVKNISKDDLLKLEGKIFGSSDEKVGAKFRMMVEPVSVLNSSKTVIQFVSVNTFPFMGYNEGCEFSVKIIPLNNMDVEDINVMFSSIWLWGNLGGIGQRARRGFGSPVIYIDNNNDSVGERFEALGLPIKRSFETDTELKEHIKKGVKAVWDKTLKWCQNNDISSFIPTIHDPESKAPSNPQFFIVSSLKQISIAKKGLDKNVNGALNKIHGRSNCPDLGTATPRKASPVFIRLHKVKDEYYPVVTWSTPKTSGCAREYIYNNCNCSQYLDDRTTV